VPPTVCDEGLTNPRPGAADKDQGLCALITGSRRSMQARVRRPARKQARSRRCGEMTEQDSNRGLLSSALHRRDPCLLAMAVAHQ